MKLKISFVLASLLASATLHALPIHVDVELTTQPPQVFTLQRPRGETYELEAVLKRHGKPFEPAITNACIYWQTNGMENLYWSAPASVSNNVLRATWLPSMDPGATTVRGYIGDPGHIYAAAFQFRFIASPGDTPNELPLPQKVIDFAKVTVLNPPWSGGGGGIDTNAVRDIVREQLATNGIRSVDGAARPLPCYLHALDFADSYTNEAAAYYRSRGNGKVDGGCSAVRSGGFLYRNFDYPFDDRAEFVVKMSAGPNRFASVGVAQVGTNLTEQIVTSGKWSKWYKALPGATVDGINENGVVAEINVVDTQVTGWHTNATDKALHPLAAVRWILDNATNAKSAAEYIAANIRFPAGWTQNFHYMIADETATYIVEDGTAHNIISSPVAMTNFKIFEDSPRTGEGQERYDALMGGANITSQWWTLTYTAAGYRASDLPGITGSALTQLFNYWGNNPRESHRGEKFGDLSWWQTVHTSVYDISNRVLRVAVQETDDWYTFAVDQANVDLTPIEAQIAALQSGKLDKADVVQANFEAADGKAAEAKTARNIEDRAVYGESMTDELEWTPALPSEVYMFHYPNTPDAIYPDQWIMKEVGDSDPTFAGQSLPKGNSESTVLSWAANEWYGGYPIEARRKTALVPKQNQKLAAVATDNASKPANGDLMKYDAANDRFVKATAGTDYVRDVSGLVSKVGRSEMEQGAVIVFQDGGIDLGGGYIGGTGAGINVGFLIVGGVDFNDKADRATTLSGYGITDATPLSMISASDPTFSNEVAAVSRKVSPPPSPYLRLYDEVRQCWWIGRMVNGVINWEVE